MANPWEDTKLRKDGNAVSFFFVLIALEALDCCTYPSTTPITPHPSLPCSLSIMSLVRVISFDPVLQGIVSNPAPAYAALRNATLVDDQRPRTLAPGERYTPLLSAGGAGAGAAIDFRA